MKTSPGRRTPAVRSAPVVIVLVLASVVGFGSATALDRIGGTAANQTYQVKTVELASGAGAVARWNPCQKAIAWRANLRGTPPAERSVMLEQFKTAFARLAAANGMTYRYAGTTGFVPRRKNLVSQPADIVVATVDASETDLALPERSLGFGGVLWATWYGAQGEGAAVVRGYVVLPPSGLLKLKAGFGSGRTQGDMILHELGHATGLEHVPSRAALMYPELTPAAPNGYARGDLTGLGKLGVRPGCITIPPRVDIKDYS